MSYNLQANVSFSVGGFSDSCATLGLPAPTTLPGHYGFVVDAAMAEIYSEALRDIMLKTVSITRAELGFALVAEAIGQLHSSYKYEGTWLEGPRQPFVAEFY